MGGPNAGCFYLFGHRFENRVIPLLDARTPQAIAEPPLDAEYIVFPEGDTGREHWAKDRHFKPLFRVLKEERCLFAVFTKRGPGT
jgi:hypothetical protein